MAPPRQFASVFFIGFLALALALAFGSISGHFLDLHPSLVALRYFGLGWMAAGMALWIALRRHEAGKPGVNLLLLFLVGASMTVSVVGLLLPFAAFGPILTWGLIGFALSAAALLIGVIVMIFAPAFPQPITKRWETESPAPVPGDHQPHSTDSGG